MPKSALLAYATTKGAIVTLTKALAQEAIQHGVRVNADTPGPVWTPLILYSMPSEQASEFGQTTLFQRPAQAPWVAPVYVVLASDGASYVTGERYGVSGMAALPQRSHRDRAVMMIQARRVLLTENAVC